MGKKMPKLKWLNSWRKQVKFNSLESTRMRHRKKTLQQGDNVLREETLAAGVQSRRRRRRINQ